MNKGNIIKVVSVFGIIAIFMYLSKLLLGSNNAIMGMLIVLSTLMLLGKDLTGNPYRNILKLSLLGVGSVVFAYLANLNVFLGLIINLIWIFILIYVNVFNLKIPMYISFLLTYLMLLVLKTTPIEIIPRSIALIFAAFLVVGIQILIRKKKLKNNKRPNLKKSLEIMDRELANIVNRKDTSLDKQDFYVAMKTWNSNILERRQNNFYFTAGENTQSIMIANLEKLQQDIVAIEKLYKTDEGYEVVLVSLRLVVNEVIKFIKNTSTSENIQEKLQQYLLKAEEKANNYYVYSVSETMKLLLEVIQNPKMETEDVKVLKKERSLVTLIKYSFRKDSLRFTFAIRMAILMAVTYFIVTVLKLEYGKWILFTLMSVCQPYDSTTTKAGVDRIKGTVIGAVIVFITFTLIQFMPLRMGIMGLGFYAILNVKNPIGKGIGSTVFALSIAELGVKAGQMSMIITADRIMYTFIGFVVAILGSKAIYQYDITKETKTLVEAYYKIINENVKMIVNMKDTKETGISLRASMLVTKSMESKLIINNSILKNAGVDIYLEDARNVMINIYSTLKRYHNVSTEVNLDEIKNKLKSVYSRFETSYDYDVVEKLDKNFELNQKSAFYISLAEVIEGLAKTKNSKANIAL
ncbi:MAG: FUSC family protein [Sarcina sp.]